MEGKRLDYIYLAGQMSVDEAGDLLPDPHVAAEFFVQIPRVQVCL